MRVGIMTIWEFALVACTLCGGASEASAAIVLDQSADPGKPIHAYIVETAGQHNGQDVAQTFVPAVSGVLSSIDVLIDQVGSNQQPVTVDVRSAPGGTPQVADVPVLGSVDLAPSQIPVLSQAFQNNPTWTSVDFSSADIPVTAGVPLAIVLRSEEDSPGGYQWFCSNQGDNIYASGSSWIRPGETTDAWAAKDTQNIATDQGFHDYVSVPEPSDIVSVACVGWMLISARFGRGDSFTSRKGAPS